MSSISHKPTKPPGTQPHQPTNLRPVLQLYEAENGLAEAREELELTRLRLDIARQQAAAAAADTAAVAAEGAATLERETVSPALMVVTEGAVTSDVPPDGPSGGALSAVPAVAQVCDCNVRA